MKTSSLSFISLLLLFLSNVSCGSEPNNAEIVYTSCYSYNDCDFKPTPIKVGNITGKIIYAHFNNPEDSLNGIKISFIDNQKEARPITIHKFLQDGSFYPIIEAVGGYTSLNGAKKIIVVITSKDIYGKSLAEFKGENYEIYIADLYVNKNKKIQIKEDKTSLKGVRQGQVGKWEDGEVERFKFTTINIIKEELKKEGL
ncbi:hypothetical protein [Acinetobacter vivianii]|uniref:hypothetical protein n=1 Tax=Acinetobacter vivianii TaxID=1776742 RepID=UPI002DB64627|nr:hypothetical protein [Acinetobacter vivianii]MEB6479744.1 hypothetical protein [Acinetobacter vivianii]MEB6658494.1 hypothetical protein [Acinetobacter vivianii]